MISSCSCALAAISTLTRDALFTGKRFLVWHNIRPVAPAAPARPATQECVAHSLLSGAWRHAVPGYPKESAKGGDNGLKSVSTGVVGCPRGAYGGLKLAGPHSCAGPMNRGRPPPSAQGDSRRVCPQRRSAPVLKHSGLRFVPFSLMVERGPSENRNAPNRSMESGKTPCPTQAALPASPRRAALPWLVCVVF